MLQSIRDHTQGWIAGSIISLLILLFGLWGINSYLVGNSTTTTVAKVNGTEITKGQLAVAYERLRRQLQMQYSSNYAMPEGVESELKDRALQTLIDIQVLKQASIDQDYRISERQVDGLLESMPQFQVNNQFSLTRFQQVLSTTLFNPADFLELLKTSLLIDQPRLGIVFSSFSLPDEVKEAGVLVNQERDINYVILPTQAYVSRVTSIPEDQIQAYYKAHQDEFKTPEQVSVEYLELSMNDLMSSIHPSDAELRKFYNENSNSFAQPMQWKLEAILIPLLQNASDKDVITAQNKMTDILQKISKGESFSNYAHQYPAGKLSEKLQGLLTLNKIPQELQKSVMGLTKTGQVGTPVRVASGIIVLKAVELNEPKAQAYDTVKTKVRDALVHQQAEEKFATLRDKLANSTYEHPDSLEPAAHTLGLTIKSTEIFTREKGGKDLSANNKIREAAFNNEVLNLQNNSDIIQIGTDSAVVLRVKSHVPAALLSLTTVEKQITDKLKQIEADKLTLKQANTIKDTLQAGGQMELTWNKAGFLGRHTTKVDSAILNEAFAMPKPTSNGKATYSTVRVQNGYAVVALNAVRDGKLNNTHDEYDLFAEQFQNSQGLLEYELYKDSLIKQSKIEIDTKPGKTDLVTSQ